MKTQSFTQQPNSGEKKGGGDAGRVASGEGLHAGLLQGEAGGAEAQRERIVMEIKKFVFNKEGFHESIFKRTTKVAPFSKVPLSTSRMRGFLPKSCDLFCLNTFLGRSFFFRQE